MTALSRLRAWLAVTAWYYRQVWRRVPIDQEHATHTRLPHPGKALETPATPPQTPLHDTGGQGSEHEVAATRGALLRLRGETTDPNSWKDSRV